MKRFLLIIAALLSLIIAIFLCELILSFSKYQPKLGFYEFAVNGKSDAYIHDPNLIYRFRNQQFYRNFKNPTPTSSLKTVVMLGDSVTWSYGADDNHTYPQNFEKIFNQNHPNNKINVYNYGVPGYGLDQEYLLLQQEILPKLSPDLVVWNINENDIRDSNLTCLYRYHQNQWQKIPATHNLAYWYSLLGSKLPNFVTNSKIYRFVWNNSLRFLTPDNSEALYTLNCSSSTIDSDTNNFIIQKLNFFIQELQKQFSQTHTQLIITLVPYQKYFDPNSSPKDLDLSYFLIKNTLASQKINFLDFNEVILNKIKSEKINNSLNPAQDLFLDQSLDENEFGLRHPNQKMYSLMAQSLLDHLNSYSITL